jgi:hypothetical protein
MAIASLVVTFVLIPGLRRSKPGVPLPLGVEHST